MLHWAAEHSYVVGSAVSETAVPTAETTNA
jgi:hypothetical protein